MADREYRAGRLKELIRLNTECGAKEDDQGGHKQLVETLRLARAAAQKKLDDAEHAHIEAEQQCIDTHAAQHGVETEYHRAKAAFGEL